MPAVSTGQAGARNRREPGALADLLLVDGDPIANIRLIEDPAKNFVVIVKDGRIYKDVLGGKGRETASE